MNLEELCSWLSHQRGMMAQTYAKDLAKYIVRNKPMSEQEIMSLTCECLDDGTFNKDCAVDFARAIEEKHGIK
jgi:hypothetical protein